MGPATISREVKKRIAAAHDRAEIASHQVDREHTRGLLLIGFFKLSKASLAVLSGFAAYHLTQVDSGELAMELISLVHINPMGKAAQLLMDQADEISAHGLRRLGMLSFVLAVLYLVEGGGLMLQQVWAEYLTVVMTAGAMPWEIYELAERYTIFRLGLLLANAAVVAYLAVLLYQKRRAARRALCASGM